MTDNREKVAADFRNEISHAFEPGAKVMSADRELRYCLEFYGCAGPYSEGCPESGTCGMLLR